MPHPEPVVRARPATPDETPRTAASLMKKATEFGWCTSATYAHGTSIDAQGRPSRLVESVVVRLLFRPAQARAVAVWVDGKFSVAFIWAAWSELERVGARAVSGWVASVPQIVGAAA